MIEHVLACCEFLPVKSGMQLYCDDVRMIYLHILHRIRRLGMIVGVLGKESEGERGYLANMAFSGILPSPSEVQSIRLMKSDHRFLLMTSSIVCSK